MHIKIWITNSKVNIKIKITKGKVHIKPWIIDNSELAMSVRGCVGFQTLMRMGKLQKTLASSMSWSWLTNLSPTNCYWTVYCALAFFLVYTWNCYIYVTCQYVVFYLTQHCAILYKWHEHWKTKSQAFLMKSQLKSSPFKLVADWSKSLFNPLTQH